MREGRRAGLHPGLWVAVKLRGYLGTLGWLSDPVLEVATAACAPPAPALLAALPARQRVGGTRTFASVEAGVAWTTVGRVARGNLSAAQIER